MNKEVNPEETRVFDGIELQLCHTAEVPTPSGAALDGSGYWMTGSIDPASVVVTNR